MILATRSKQPISFPHNNSKVERNTQDSHNKPENNTQNNTQRKMQSNAQTCARKGKFAKQQRQSKHANKCKANNGRQLEATERNGSRREATRSHGSQQEPTGGWTTKNRKQPRSQSRPWETTGDHRDHGRSPNDSPVRPRETAGRQKVGTCRPMPVYPTLIHISGPTTPH